MLSSAVVEARLPTRDLARARRWYSDKLGLEPVEERDGGLRYEGRADVFCLFVSAGSSDGSFSQMAFYVDDIETTVAGLKARGVVFEEYPGCINSIMDIQGNYPAFLASDDASFITASTFLVDGGISGAYVTPM